MMIHEITPSTGKYKKRKRIGRGHASGHGKTCGRGHKGFGSRSGYSRKPGHEGGQMPLFRRVPKRGFTNARFKKIFAVINVKVLEARFADGAEVNPATLVDAGLVRNLKTPVKVLGEGDIAKKLTLTVAACSSSAKEKIEKAGGSVTIG